MDQETWNSLRYAGMSREVEHDLRQAIATNNVTHEMRTLLDSLIHNARILRIEKPRACFNARKEALWTK